MPVDERFSSGPSVELYDSVIGVDKRNDCTPRHRWARRYQAVLDRNVVSYETNVTIAVPDQFPEAQIVLALGSLIGR